MGSAKRYFGKVCAKHPELKGERRVSSRCCAKCSNEKSRKWAAEHPDARRGIRRKALQKRINKFAGFSVYFGSPCKFGHSGERYVSGQTCVECVKARPPKTLEDSRRANRKWRAKNIDRERGRAQAFDRLHPELAAARRRRFQKNNPGYFWRRLKNRTPGWLTDQDWLRIHAAYARAKELSRQTGIRHEVDHHYPLQGKTVSGLHVPDNLLVVTASHNRHKGNRHPAP